MKLKPGEKPVTELYDIAHDPAEAVDVAKKNREVVRRLEKLMEESRSGSEEFPLKPFDG